MSSVKKVKPIPPLISREEAEEAFKILIFRNTFVGLKNKVTVNKNDEEIFDEKYLKLQNAFERKYKRTFFTVLDYFADLSETASISRKNFSPEAIYDYFVDIFKKSEIEPVQLGLFYGFKGFLYSVNGHFTNDEIRLLILEEFDRERKLFEKLKAKFDETKNEGLNYERSRIPEKVRIEVWRRDGGTCARCGSREKLEYDHIVPISKGGSNTSRNIELLCEKCNRSKSNNVV